ncbi:MAG: hypothetical protein U0795_19085 [Pirellulales bacterium]
MAVSVSLGECLGRWSHLAARSGFGALLLLATSIGCTEEAAKETADAEVEAAATSADIELSQSVEGSGSAGTVSGTHQQVRLIKPTNDEPGLMLKSFCLMPDGKLLALVDGGAPVWGGIPTFGSTPDGKAPGCEVRIIDQEGNKVHSFPVDFSGHSVNVGSDGNIYVGGNGIVAKFDPTGKQLIQTASPNMSADSQTEEVLRQRAMETLTEQKAAYAEALATLEKQQKEMEGKSDDELTEEQRESKLMMEPMITAYKQAMAQYNEPSEEQIKQIVESLSSRQKTINAIAVNDKYVFVTCAASKGYGYSVWRTDLDFQNPAMIVDGLRGCCGQMDVQCCGEELVVAENSRHRVVRYDAEGKEVLTFGKRSRDGVGEGFGSCCNPMNTRLVGDNLYVAESDGNVKLFSQDGKFLNLVGKADVQAGCKSSIVAASPDGERVYYFDVQKSGICVLEKVPAATEATP